MLECINKTKACRFAYFYTGKVLSKAFCPVWHNHCSVNNWTKSGAMRLISCWCCCSAWRKEYQREYDNSPEALRISLLKNKEPSLSVKIKVFLMEKIVKHWSNLAVENVEFHHFVPHNYANSCWGWDGCSWFSFELNDHSKEWALEEIRFLLLLFFISSNKPTNKNSIKFLLCKLSSSVLLFAAITSTLLTSLCLFKSSLC